MIPLRLLLIFLGILLLAGCEEEKSPTGIRFDHEKHLGRGFDCGLCHQFLSYTEPERPSERVCRFCHEVGDHAEPSLDCALCHTRTDLSAAGLLRPTFRDNHFQHEKHLKKGLACLECHREQQHARSYEEIVFPAMNVCIACHENTATARRCETCHQYWREDTKPESHELGWIKAHGPVAVDRFETNCDYCHPKKTFCLDCHTTRQPQSHTLFFRNRGHGFWAATNRDSCRFCHLQEFCLRCHGPDAEVRPMTHRAGSWARRPYLHCTQCHFPGGEIYGCKTCHRPGIIQTTHREFTEGRSNPIPSFVVEFSLNCLSGCHPYDRRPPNHPLGVLNNNDCLRCHSP